MPNKPEAHFPFFPPTTTVRPASSTSSWDLRAEQGILKGIRGYLAEHWDKDNDQDADCWEIDNFEGTGGY
ncbi:hypothetical protein PM082_018460 [Marasmius tenuissimus]|nr:hypothetical protein PM082_018460 [Marasmius tenuissimus]